MVKQQNIANIVIVTSQWIQTPAAYHQKISDDQQIVVI